MQYSAFTSTITFHGTHMKTILALFKLMVQTSGLAQKTCAMQNVSTSPKHLTSISEIPLLGSHSNLIIKFIFVSLILPIDKDALAS